ncbi:MAG: APC family permease [Jatrophihabitans sp.]|uniref:APC family permease n=1 Tax=Jatrophihabitans sp. TaxID=1932789 RepID=UPI003F7DAE9F
MTVLERRLGTQDAVVVGLGAMLGAGVFASLGPATRVAGPGVLISLVLAAVVAYCNADSSARLAARYPRSGGTYVYGRERLGPFWGHLAGWAFVVGKTASCAAIAVTFGAYAWPAHPHVAAVAIVTVAAALDAGGVQKSAAVTRVIVALVLLTLAFVVVACLGAGSPSASRLHPFPGGSAHGVLTAAGLIFFAFAGYARIATLGEEVRDPERTIGRAVRIALGTTVVTYAAVFVSVLLAVGPAAVAGQAAPLRVALRAGDWSGAAPIVQVGAALAAAGSLVPLLLGVSRTSLAMARDGYLPGPVGRVDGGTPRVAVAVLGVIVVVLAATLDLRHAIGFSSFGVLTYYAVANASAWTLSPAPRHRFVPALGLVGCVVLAFALPGADVLTGLAALVLGAVSFVVVEARRRGSANS